MKKVISLALCLMLVLSLAVPVMAAETTYQITINNTDPGHTYEAYQLFTGSLSDDGTTLSNVQWGSSVPDGAALLAAILADTTPITEADSTTSLSVVFAGAASAADVATRLGTVSNDSATLDRFAEVVGKVTYTKDSGGNVTAATHDYLGAAVSTTNIHVGNNSYVLANLPAGYYLIKDQEMSQNGDSGFYTKYIVRVVKTDSVNVKGSTVTFDKSINDTLDGTYDNIEDFDINDTAYYKWTGTLPTNLRAYETFWYKFTDTLPNGVNFKQIEAVYLEDHNGIVVHTFYTAGGTYPAGITFGSTANTEGKVTGITMEFNDLLALHPTLLSTHKVIVKYSCTVNRDALIKNANTNTAYLEFSNNPNGEGHGKTVEDKAHAFTFSFTVDKYDMANKATKLENVKFRLYYRVDTGSSIQYMYAKVITEEMVAAHESINGKVVESKDVGVVYGWTDTEADSSILDTDSNGAFTIKGLDEGTYFLKEIETVDGYNLLTTPVQIDIIPTYTEAADKSASATVEYKVDSISQGTGVDSDVVGIRNSKGASLPSTGGIGTTLFYVVGALMVGAAGVLLVTKKRMSAEN